MDLKALLTWSMIALVVAGLVYMYRLRKKSRDKKVLAALLTLAKENNAIVSEYDFWENTLIGIDRSENSKLFFIRNIPGRQMRQCISVSEIANCKLHRTEQKVKYNKELVDVIERIELIISFKKHKDDLVLEFYNTDFDHHILSRELQLAQKWNDIVNDIVTLSTGSNLIYHDEGMAIPLIDIPVDNKNTSTNYVRIRKPVDRANAG